MANVIPMAGLGTRFSKEGYTLPKALIPVSGVPMIIKAIRDMPPSDRWIFVVRQDHIDHYNIDSVITHEIPNAIIIPITKTTEGQACTALLAEPHVDPEEPILVAACDNGYLYDKVKYESLIADNSVDAIVWTFTQRETLRRNPTAWGWYHLEDDGVTIRGASVKVPVSHDPYNDHAVTATFFFKKAKEFIEATKLMIKENYRINNEFYVDTLPVFYKKLGKRAVIFDVTYYFGWGTPKDLYDYQLLEYVATHNASPAILSEEDQRILPKLLDYFKVLHTKKTDTV